MSMQVVFELPARSSASERRLAPRLKAEDVPWIVNVQPLAGTIGRLLDISSTGVLLESRARMLPHRKHAILIETDEEQKERLDATVVRTQLVALGRGSNPIYRCALIFSKGFSSYLQEKVASALPAQVLSANPLPPRPQLAGPFDALWATEHGSQVTTAWRVMETGCLVQIDGGATIGQWASVRIYFSPTRHLLLTGRVSGLDASGYTALRFEQLAPDDRRALRLELRGHVFDGASAAPAKGAPAGLIVTSTSRIVPGRVAIQGNAW